MEFSKYNLFLGTNKVVSKLFILSLNLLLFVIAKVFIVYVHLQQNLIYY
jgi:hypothetical protein